MSRHFISLICVLCLSCVGFVCNGQERQENELSSEIYKSINELNANIIFIRHALAPGIGDPKGFDIKDCTTQRNLNYIGRVQAQSLGQFFRETELKFDEILSSEWCRCWQTAELLKLGPWKPFSGLNSFFEDHKDKNSILTILGQKINSLSKNSLVLMVTHQVVISAITGHHVPSGGVVIYNSIDQVAQVIKINR